LTELLDTETGLGAPAEYRFPRSARPPPRPERDRERDRILSELALEALQRGGEVVLDAPTIGRLARQDKPLPPPGLDLHAELVAAHPAAVDEGEFQVILTPWPGSLTAGATFGRFAYLLGGAPLLQDGGAATPPRHLGRSPIVRCAPGAPHRNVTRTAHWLPNRVTVGAFGGERPGDISIADLAVAADGQRLRVFCVSRGRELDASAHNMLNPARTSPNEARFLRDVSLMASGAFLRLELGRGGNLPVLPRVRYQRTVIAPGELALHGIRNSTVRSAGPGGRRRFEAWRRRWSVPESGSGWEPANRQLRLDLLRQWHRWLIERRSTEAAHGASVVLQGRSAALGGAGWLGDPGVIAELVVGPTARPIAPLPGRANAPRAPAGCTPTCPAENGCTQSFTRLQAGSGP